MVYLYSNKKVTCYCTARDATKPCDREGFLVAARLSVLSANVIIHYNEAQQCTLNSAFKHRAGRHLSAAAQTIRPF